MATHKISWSFILPRNEYTEAIRDRAAKLGSNTTAILELLPWDVQTGIYAHLDYQSLLCLSQTSHYFRKKVLPEKATLEDKLQFVMRAEKDFPQHRCTEDFPGNFGCYFCFRVLSPSSFAKNQREAVYLDRSLTVIPDDAVDLNAYRKLQLRRFCVNCGIVYGFHRIGERLTTLDGDTFWLCRCQKVRRDWCWGCGMV